MNERVPGRVRTVSGYGGDQLVVEEFGRTSGPAIVFVHGFAHGRQTWRHQVRSTLADEFRLVTYDLRGHGASDEPLDGYGEGAAWADDLKAVIDAIGAPSVTLVGWSYGGLVLTDYLRRHGEDGIAALDYVGAVTSIGIRAANAGLGPEFVALFKSLYSDRFSVGIPALRRLINLSTAEPLSEEDRYLFLGLGTATPPYVRENMFHRRTDHTEFLPTLRTPTLVSHGTADRIILPTVAENTAASIGGARLSWYEGVGHMPFWERPDRFNAELCALVHANL